MRPMYATKYESRILTFAIAADSDERTLIPVDSREGRMIVRGYSGLELAFLSLTAAGVMGIIAAGLQVVFRIAG
jgi:hypothetical protein